MLLHMCTCTVVTVILRLVPVAHAEKASSFHRETRFIIYMVAEQFRLVVGERISERICEQIADVHVPQVVEQIIEVPKMAEQILDVLVLETVEQSVKLPSTISEDRIQERTAQAHRGTFQFRRMWRKLVKVPTETPASFTRCEDH